MAGAEISIFIAYLRNERKYADHTLKAYQNDLEEFDAYSRSTYQLHDLTETNHHIIRSWLAGMMQQELEPTTVRRKLSALKSYFKHLQRTGVLENNPAKSVTGPKLKKRLPVAIERNEAEKLMELLAREGETAQTFEQHRDLLLIKLLYATGMRRQEIITLKINDVDLSAGLIKVMGKRSKERIIPLPAPLIADIENYINIATGILDNSLYLFVKSEGGPIDPTHVYNLVKNYLNMVTAQKKKSPHVLRHSYATHLLDEGADINAIKELLGHSSLAATQVYTGNSIAKLKEVYKQAHPRSNKS